VKHRLLWPRRIARAARAAAVGALAMLAAGCASFDGLAPSAHRTDAATLAAKAALAEQQPSAVWPKSDWWRRFGDAQLDALIAEALAGNPGIDSARALSMRARSLRLPAPRSRRRRMRSPT
jgi:outer membrane protein TolC